MSKITKSEALIEFQWPEASSERKRILADSEKYKSLSIAEAFAAAYGVEYDKGFLEDREYIESEKCNTKEVKVGDVIDVTVEAISRKDATLSYHNSKQIFTIKQDMSGWNVSPGSVLKVSVIEKVKDRLVVDAIDPLYREWLEKVSKTLSNNFQSYEVKVKNLEVQKYGYTGVIEIPEVSSLIGKPYYIDAFIPGSQITLNIEDDFNRWEGKSVDTMVTNFTQRGNKFSVVCSRKKLLMSAGGTSLVNIYDAGYGKGIRFSHITFEGKVLGILNSSRKQGVFVEVPDYNITGLIEKEPRELVKYRKGEPINVQIDRFDWDPKRPPYRRNKDGMITEVNLKPIFVEVK